jgi:hypothetical protein
MKAHLANRSANTCALAAVTLILAAYPLARIVVPLVLHAVVPNTIRSVLNLI